MDKYGEEPISVDPSGRFHTIQPLRDLESNWAVDLAKNLEEYLLKICSGEIAGDDDGDLSVNFAEAALLLQGSIQVYSRKVEYLYSLVVHALDFISQNRQHNELERTSVQHGSNAVPDEESDLFWDLDDIPVEAKNSLDSASCRDAPSNHFVKPPANLVVLEGDCLDATGDGGELEAYLIAINDLYQDFILLDPCDTVAVNDFLKCDKACKGQSGICRGTSKFRKNFQSPTKRSGGSGHKFSVGKSHDCNLSRSPCIDRGFEFNDCNIGPDPPAYSVSQNNSYGFEMDDGYSEPCDLADTYDDDDDPWEPLNPHEPGTLKVKPFKKVKALRRREMNSTKRIHITTQFPLARMYGTISSELTEIWEGKHRASETQRESQSPPLYEKLRQSLVHGGLETGDAFFNSKDDKKDNGYDSGDPDFDMPEGTHMHEDVPSQPEKDDGAIHFDTTEAYGHEDPNLHKSLEDLCQSHLDALLASIAETEKQTELAARVSTWKQRIEQNLEEQDSHPPFDIHEYSERVLDKLSLEADNRNIMSFADVVTGEEKHEVARTFSALLQLVNNENVDLMKDGADGESKCYTAVNPFHIRLLSHDKRREEMQLRSSRKRAKSPTNKGCTKANRVKSVREKNLAVSSSPSGSNSTAMSVQLNCKLSLKLGKVGGARFTPDGKRRRRSRLVELVDLHS